MKRVYDFLSELRHNNNKPWFDENKERYKEALGVFNTFGESLIAAIGVFDPDVAGLTVHDCTYRIYRDMRFSADKTPYKTHMGLYVCRGGKKSGYAGYYFHFEPEGNGAYSFISAGMYMPEPKVLKSIREEILDNGSQFVEAVERAEGFTMSTESQLKKTTAGFPSDSPYDHYLRMRNHYVERRLSRKELLSPGLCGSVASEFEKTKPLMDIINRAVTYAYEEM